MKLICSVCGRDLNMIFQDNMSYLCGKPLCEDCFNKGWNVNEVKEEDEYE